jgi:mono/diheme cytochrome c family protein
VSAPAQQTGEQIFGVNCARCHAAVEIDRRIRNDWAGRPASALFEITRQTMPADAPGSLSDSDYLEILAYMLDLSNVQRPAGELSAGSLGGILLQAGASTGEGARSDQRG